MLNIDLRNHRRRTANQQAPFYCQISANQKLAFENPFFNSKLFLKKQKQKHKMDWDTGVVTSMNVGGHEPNGDESTSRYGLQNRYREFLRTYRQGSHYLYRDQLLSNVRKQLFYLLIDLGHLNAYDASLQNALLENPIDILPLMEAAASEILTSLLRQEKDEKMDIQIVLKSDQIHIPLRHIHAQEMNQLIKIPGIVISATKVRAKSVGMKIKCRHCGNTKMLPCTSPFGGISIPQVCDRPVQEELNEQKCPHDPYVILPDQCKYVDQQTLKLQENPEVVPTGEMPRNVLLAANRFLVDRASPGTRVSVIGISSVFSSKKNSNVGAVAIKMPYIRVVGIEVDEEGSGRARDIFTPAEEDLFHDMARDEKIYEKIASSIAPSIYGAYTENIKKAIACQLIGGSRKQLPDGMMVRFTRCFFLQFLQTFLQHFFNTHIPF